jgi:hypothetical protein
MTLGKVWWSHFVCKNFAKVFNTLVKGELISADNKAEHNEGRGIVSMQSKDKGKSLFIVFFWEW